ncbi:MAG: YdeI/OmpD-associated family protein [bacterium]
MKRPSRQQVQIFETAAGFRDWLASQHDVESETWIGRYKKGVPKTSMSYQEAVDEALCFGWIDSISYRIDNEVFAIRFTPRRKTSNWSEANIARVAELEAEDRMHPAGLAAFAARKQT